MEKEYTPDSKAWTLMIILSLLWGSSFLLLSKSLTVFSPHDVNGLRMIFAALVLSFYFFPNIKKIPKDRWIYILLSGYLGFLVPFLLIAIGQTHVKSSMTGVLMSLNPALTLVFAVLFFKTKLKITQAIGVLIGLAGCMMVSFIGPQGGFGDFNYFTLYIVMAMILFSTSVNVVKEKLSDIDAVLVVAASMVVIAPVCITFLLFSDFTTIMKSHPDAWEYLGYTAILGVIATGIPYVMYYKVIMLSNVVFASTANYYTALVALVLGIFFGNPIYPMDYVAIALIMTGVLIVGMKWHKHDFLHRL